MLYCESVNRNEHSRSIFFIRIGSKQVQAVQLNWFKLEEGLDSKGQGLHSDIPHSI